MCIVYLSKATNNHCFTGVMRILRKGIELHVIVLIARNTILETKSQWGEIKRVVDIYFLSSILDQWNMCRSLYATLFTAYIFSQITLSVTWTLYLKLFENKITF